MMMNWKGFRSITSLLQQSQHNKQQDQIIFSLAEGCERNLIQVLSQYLLGGAEENHEQSQSG
jgi:hypothetical protein